MANGTPTGRNDKWRPNEWDTGARAPMIKNQNVFLIFIVCTFTNFFFLYKIDTVDGDVSAFELSAVATQLLIWLYEWDDACRIAENSISSLALMTRNNNLKRRKKKLLCQQHTVAVDGHDIHSASSPARGVRRQGAALILCLRLYYFPNIIIRCALFAQMLCNKATGSRCVCPSSNSTFHIFLVCGLLSSLF